MVRRNKHKERTASTVTATWVSWVRTQDIRRQMSVDIGAFVYHWLAHIACCYVKNNVRLRSRIGLAEVSNHIPQDYRKSGHRGAKRGGNWLVSQ